VIICANGRTTRLSHSQNNGLIDRRMFQLCSTAFAIYQGKTMWNLLTTQQTKSRVTVATPASSAATLKCLWSFEYSCWSPIFLFDYGGLWRTVIPRLFECFLSFTEWLKALSNSGYRASNLRSATNHNPTNLENRRSYSLLNSNNDFESFILQDAWIATWDTIRAIYRSGATVLRFDHCKS